MAALCVLLFCVSFMSSSIETETFLFLRERCGVLIEGNGDPALGLFADDVLELI